MNGSQALEAAADAPQLKGLVKDKRWLWHEFRSCSFFEAFSQHEMRRRFLSARSRVGSWRRFFLVCQVQARRRHGHPLLQKRGSHNCNQKHLEDYWVAVKELKLSYHNGYM